MCLLVASVKVIVMVMFMVMVVLPDGGHGLDAEEQSRGKVVHASDTLGIIINPEKKIKRWKLMSNPVFVKLFSSIRPRSSIGEGGELVAGLEGNLHKHHYKEASESALTVLSSQSVPFKFSA